MLTNVAVLGKKGESFEEFNPEGGASAVATTSEEALEEVPKPAAEESPKVIEFEVETDSSDQHLRISPLAKSMAQKLGVDITAVKGSGPQGRIIARDIETAASAAPARSATVHETAPEEKPATKKITDTKTAVVGTGEDFEIKSIPNIRKLIATAMYNSLHNSAQLTHHLSADARQIMKLRKRFKNEYAEGKISQNVTINDMVCFAVIRALKKYPVVNTHYLGDKMKWFSKVHLGLAVDTERGLMVPALKNSDDLSITGLSYQLQQLAGQCRTGSINPDLLSPEAASFTVSNLGNYGVEMFTPVINLPQSAILGVCTIIPRPKDIGEGVYGFVPMIGLSLTYNHQALDGGEATRFLSEIKNQIENLNL